MRDVSFFIRWMATTGFCEYEDRVERRPRQFCHGPIFFPLLSEETRSRDCTHRCIAILRIPQILKTSTNVIKNCSAYSELMTSYALGWLAGTRRTLQQRVQVDVMAAILKIWRHIRNPIPLIDAYLVEEQSYQFHPDLIWNDWALGFFEESFPTRTRTKNNNKMGSVPDWKIFSSSLKVQHYVTVWLFLYFLTCGLTVVSSVFVAFQGSKNRCVYFIVICVMSLCLTVSCHFRCSGSMLITAWSI